MSSTLTNGSKYQIVNSGAETPKHRDLSDADDRFLIPRKAVPNGRTEVADAVMSEDEAVRDNDTSRGQPDQYKDQKVLQIWWLEVLCCVVFVAALFAVVATIYPYSGRAPPNWKYGLTLNTFIAIEITILKAAMILVTAEGLSQLKWSHFARDNLLHDLATYDEASRGPWGALLLLFRLRECRLASYLGALVVLGALIVDPFGQQLISTQDCQVLVAHTSASIPRTNYFNESAKTGADGATASLPLQNAINAGIYAPGATVVTGCQTGNCTFTQPYSTVGYCGSCKDLTASVVVNVSGQNEFVEPLAQYPYQLNLPTTTTTTTTLSLGNGSLFVIDQAAGVIAVNLFEDTASCSQNPGPSNGSLTNLKWGCTTLGMNLYGDGKISDPKAGAAVCSLSPCVRTYTANVTKGVLEEQLLGVPFNLPSTLSATVFDVECLSQDERDALETRGYDLTGKSWIANNLTTPYTTGFDANSSDIAISYSCIYGFLVDAMLDISVFTKSWLNGQLTYVDPVTRDGPAVLQAIFNTGDLTFDALNATWWNMSDSMTTYIRQHGAGNSGIGFSYSDPASGQVWTERSCIRVQWLFILYPALLVALALVFFIAMLMETSRGQVIRSDWKSSPLALIFHGLDTESIRQSEKKSILLNNKDMETIAQGIDVQLNNSDGTWKLTRTRQSFEMR